MGKAGSAGRRCREAVASLLLSTPVWSGNSNVSFAVKCWLERRLRTKLRTGRIHRVSSRGNCRGG